MERGIVEAMREKLVADGMFFVDIDFIGDKVVEINAESPGGMQAVERLYEIDVCPTIIEALERRPRFDAQTLRNGQLAAHNRLGVCSAFTVSEGNSVRLGSLWRCEENGSHVLLHWAQPRGADDTAVSGHLLQ